jgi:SAM-dependent methyltransferase
MTEPSGDVADIKRRTAALYTELNRRFEATATSRHARFLNFGYRPLAGEPVAGPELPPRLPNRDSAQLLLEVVGDTDLHGRVAEIGCGRGGNLWLMHRYLGATRVVGVDLTMASVRFARQDSRADHALFVNGDAESLPLATDSVDVVLSLETSCTYPDIERFYREVARVLRPGGTFLYADLMPTTVVTMIERVLARLGLERTVHRDISENVAASRRARAGRQARALAVAEDQDPNTEWVGAEGGFVHDAIRSPDHQYFLSRFRSASSPAPAPDGPLLAADERELFLAATRLGNELLAFST